MRWGQEETVRPATHSGSDHGPGNRSDGEHARASLGPGAQLTKTADDAAREREPRSNLGAIPGAEFPGFVYGSVLAAFAWIMLASWLAFARDMDASLALGVVVVLGIVFFALPIIVHHVATAFSRPRPEMPHDFLSAPVETATGPLSGASAWLQVLLIPLALALAATLIGGAYLLVVR
jgi:hypothetical protein